jgi:hypothetical protein
MNEKYKIGDPVIIVNGVKGSIGDKHIIIDMVPDNNTFEPDRWMYLINDNRKYYLYDHLKLDMQVIRQRKLNELGI